MRETFHLVPEATWAAADPGMGYEPASLETEGFIHCSTLDQVLVPANALARGRTDLVLLEIEPSLLSTPPVFEPGDAPEPMLFPHIYGPIPVAAVVAVHDFPGVRRRARARC